MAGGPPGGLWAARAWKRSATTTWAVGSARESVWSAALLFPCLAPLVEHVQHDGEDQQRPGDEILPVDIDPQQIQCVGQKSHEQGAQEGSQDRAFTAAETRPPDDGRRDDPQLQTDADGDGGGAKTARDEPTGHTR